MGTRHLTVVQFEGAYRVAQYGQWDGYPEGQGATVLEFLQSWDRPTFEAKLRASTFLTDADLESINAEIKSLSPGVQWQSKWPALTRDTGAKVLRLIHDSEPGIRLRNSIGFAGDSLFCEFAYVLDLDANTLEVYRGFRKEPLPECERFKDMPNPETSDGYYPICLAAKYPISDLPTVDKMTDDVCGKQND